MSTSFDISVETAKAPIVSIGVSEQMRAINMDTSASSVLDEPRQTRDGSDTVLALLAIRLLKLFWQAHKIRSSLLWFAGSDQT
ncbi:TPA: hypothetical protein ACH3X1_015489 [Trebouxia sp. C0004]